MSLRLDYNAATPAGVTASVPLFNSSNSLGRFACHLAEPGPSQSCLRARTPERRRKENSCRGGELSSWG
jgi:hypothetical protein